MKNETGSTTSNVIKQKKKTNTITLQDDSGLRLRVEGRAFRKQEEGNHQPCRTRHWVLEAALANKTSSRLQDLVFEFEAQAPA